MDDVTLRFQCISIAARSNQDCTTIVTEAQKLYDFCTKSAPATTPPPAHS